MTERLRQRLAAPVDGASLGVFRAAFGMMMLYSIIRFAAKGWIAELYIEPELLFPYWGFSWLAPWPGIGMYVHFALLGVLATLIMVGLWSRPALVLFFLGFTYVELLDRTTYLNHYYFISILSLLLAFLPVERAMSLSRWLGRTRARQTVPRWALVVVRVQVGLVYVFAGLAKLRADWLLRGEPLHTWLAARSDIPWIGAWLDDRAVAIGASWAGALFDLCIVPLLLWRRTRVPAYCALVGFHLVTGYLFSIGVFPIVMILGATIFFEPDWPRRLLRQPAAPPSEVSDEPRPARLRWPVAWLGVTLLAVHFAFQLAFPMRNLLYPGNTLWTEEGYRFGWRVMLMEKTGEIDLRVVDNRDGRSWLVSPRERLTPFQYRMMATQPDMILTFAHYLASEWQQRGHEDVSVYADAWAALNGRRRQRLVDPHVDLANETEGWAPKRWIVPLAPDPGIDELGNSSVAVSEPPDPITH
ncbi:MAG: HTTM domain-containing protein [Myxococcota bacterium]